jgi:hypothetical protein
VLDDFFHQVLLFVTLQWAFFGQVQARDLQTVKKKASAAGVDGVGGDALEDLTYAVLDGAAVFG